MRDLPTILVIDDDEGMREAVSICFSDSYYILTATTDDNAIFYLNNEPEILVVLIDLVATGQDRVRLIRWIRDHHPCISIIIHTGYPGAKESDEVWGLGPCDVLSKGDETKSLEIAIEGGIASALKKSDRNDI